MKTVIKNGQKYIITDTLYESIKRKSLFEDNDTTSNPLNTNVSPNNTNNTPNQNNTYQTKYDNDPEEVKNYQLSNDEITLYNGLHELFIKNIKDCLEYKKIKAIIPTEELNRYSELLKYMDKIIESVDKREFFNYLKRENIPLSDTKKLLNQMVVFSLGNIKPLTGDKIVPTYKDESFFKFAAIDDKNNLININNYQLLYTKILNNIRKKVEKLNSHLPINNDNDETNDIDALKLVDNTIGKEEIMKKTVEGIISNAPKNVTTSGIEKEIKKQMNSIILGAGYGQIKIKFENVSTKDLRNITIEISDIINGKNPESFNKTNNVNQSDLHAAIIEAKQLCDKNGWESEQIDSACQTAAKNHNVEVKTVKEHLLAELKHVSNIKQLEGVMNKVERNDIVISTLKSTKHTIDKKLTELFKSFYDVLTNKDFLNSQYMDNIDDYSKSLRNGLYTLYDHQDKFLKIIKDYNKNFTNPAVINRIIKFINEKINYSDKFVDNVNDKNGEDKLYTGTGMENILRMLKESVYNNKKLVEDAEELQKSDDKKKIKTKTPTEKLDVNFSDIENAERVVDDFMDSLQPQDITDTDFSDDGILKDFNGKSSSLESGEFLKTYKDLFTKSEGQSYSKVNSLLIDYDKMSFAILMKLLINNAYNINRREEGKDTENQQKFNEGDLSNLLKIFRFLMGRTIGEKDIDLYEEVKNNIKEKKMNSERFKNLINKIYEKLFLKFNIKLITHLKINKRELLDHLINKINDSYNKNPDNSSSVYDDDNEYNDLRRIFAYSLLTEYANKNKQIYKIDENADNLKQNDMVNIIIAHTVPQNENEQILYKDINDMCYIIHVKDINQLNKLYTEVVGDEKLKNNYNIDSKFIQETFDNFVRYIYATDKENNFVSIFKMQVLFGKTRNVLNKITSNGNSINNFGNRFKNIFK